MPQLPATPTRPTVDELLRFRDALHAQHQYLLGCLASLQKRGFDEGHVLYHRIQRCQQAAELTVHYAASYIDNEQLPGTRGLGPDELVRRM